jgi:integrase
MEDIMASVAKRKWTYNGQQREAWTVRYFDQDGRRRSKGFDLKKDADAYAKKVEREIHDGVHLTRDQALTVKQVGDLYIEALGRRQNRGEVCQLHVMKMSRFVNLHISPKLGRIVFKDIAARDVDGLYEHLCATVKPIYARQILSCLGSMEKFANRHRYLLTNPVAAALSGIAPPQQDRIRELTVEDAASLLRLARERQPQGKVRASAMMGCFVHLAGCCGLRIGEIMALKMENVDLERGVVKIRHSLNGLMEIVDPKTKSGNRDLPLPTHLKDMIAHWMAHHMRANPDGLIFTSTRGTRLFSRNITRQWYSLLDAAGIGAPGNQFHFHALRHFAGSWWLHNGMAIADVSKMMGHSSPAITMQVYAHVISTDEERHAAIASMGHRLAEISDARVPQIA